MRVEIRSVRKNARSLLTVIVTASVLLPCLASAEPIALAPYRLNDLRAEFNRASERVRLVALLSPTCGGCQRGQRVVQSIFSKYPDDARIRGFVVWLPMLRSDR